MAAIGPCVNMFFGLRSVIMIKVLGCDTIRQLADGLVHLTGQQRKCTALGQVTRQQMAVAMLPYYYPTTPYARLQFACQLQ